MGRQENYEDMDRPLFIREQTSQVATLHTLPQKCFGQVKWKYPHKLQDVSPLLQNLKIYN